MLSETQKIITNCILIILTYLIPLVVFVQNQDSYAIEKIQKIVFPILLIGSIVLTYLNYKNIIGTKNLKWFWMIFELIGVLGLVYSSIILYLIFSFRHGIGF